MEPFRVVTSISVIEDEDEACGHASDLDIRNPEYCSRGEVFEQIVDDIEEDDHSAADDIHC